MDIILPLLLQVVLIFFNAVFACAEIAIISTNDAKINKLVSEGNKKAKRLQKILEDPSKFLATIQIAITVSGFLGSAFAADNFSEMLINLLENLGIVNEKNILIFDSISVIIITLILSYFTLVFGELVPKGIAMKKSEGIALNLSTPLSIIAKLFSPVIGLLTISTNFILMLFGIDPSQSREDGGEEDILLMVNNSGEKGLIDKEEQIMIKNVFEFDDITVSEFYTHRTKIDMLWNEDNVEQWDSVIKESFHKYYPICGETVDDIIGVLDIRKYFKLSERNKNDIMKNAVCNAYFVPKTLRADALFKQMKYTKNHFAIVLDEQGGVDGVVTMDDILEQIVGDFNYQSNSDDNFIEKIDENSWRISGSVSIENVNEQLNLKLPIDECETFGGLVFKEYGTIPPDDTNFSVSICNLDIVVQKIQEHQIKEMVVKVQHS